MPSYRYPRPSLTVDVVVLSRGASEEVLLIQRKHPPFLGAWALPGGFVDEGERLIGAAARELEEETGLAGLSLRQTGAYGDPGRDPRGWTVSVAYLALVDRASVQPREGDDAAAVGWFPIAGLPPLAFDHAVILEEALAAAAAFPRER